MGKVHLDEKSKKTGISFPPEQGHILSIYDWGYINLTGIE